MAKWTISEYDTLPFDANGVALPISRRPRNSSGATAAGQVNLTGGRYVRFCGDTNAHVHIGTSGATTADEFVPAGMDYWLAPEGATAINFIVG
jgi:hypothetical protein